ncbi:MAG: PhoH family protein [Spirochaetaceae bacterium]|nr:PhoH family protein [Spirochaetaceae bacterium]
MIRNIKFDNLDKLRIICGANDSNIAYIEILLDVEIISRGNYLIVESDDDFRLDLSEDLFKNLNKLDSESTKNIDESQIFMEYQNIVSGPSVSDLLSNQISYDEFQSISVNNKTIFAKTTHQKQLIKAMDTSQISFAIGPAGTGKTFLAIAYALAQLNSGKKQKIILTRPVVEAGENLGFLPGTLSEKINPYIRPLFDAMAWMLPPGSITRMESSGAIEIAPLAYMRGRSLHNSIIILDEAQNTSKEQMKMFLTRIGENSKVIVTGDVSQIDLPHGKRSGLLHASKILRNIPGIEFVEFDSKDVVRAKIIQKIIDAYDKMEEEF